MSDIYEITDKERENTIRNYIKEDRLTVFPSKNKKKIIILEYIIKKFEVDRKYSEKEVNEIIKRIYDDFVTIRRAFVDYGLMARSDNCSHYWVKI